MFEKNHTMKCRGYYCLVVFLLLNLLSTAQTAKPDTLYLLKPDRVFDGEQVHEGWQVLVKNGKIAAAGPIRSYPPGTVIIDLKGCTLMPGLIEGHSHLFLHPYNETPWDEQVLGESRAERTARAVNHARQSLLAGFTTVRDLGTEGAQYDDAGLKKAIEKGIIPGPHLLIATRAIVAKGSYGPSSGSADYALPQGAAEVGGMESQAMEVRTQIGRGADWIKIYADYRWGPDKTEQPTFTEEELAYMVKLAHSSGRQVSAHATTAEGIRRAVMAGVNTIEHGDGGTPEVFRLMKEKGVALCPTLAAGDAVLQYQGWQKAVEKEPEEVMIKRKSFAAALAAGVTICMGGDAGVFAHGDNAREMEMMVDYGMKPVEVLRSATAVNADVFKISHLAGRIRHNLPADLLAVQGNPAVDISAVRNVKLVMLNGQIIRKE